MIETRYLKVEGHTNIVRDVKTNAIINTDISGMNNYISSRKNKEKEKEKIESICNDIENLKTSMQEIKTLLQELKNGTWKNKDRKF